MWNCGNHTIAHSDTEMHSSGKQPAPLVFWYEKRHCFGLLECCRTYFTKSIELYLKLIFLLYILLVMLGLEFNYIKTKQFNRYDSNVKRASLIYFLIFFHIAFVSISTLSLIKLKLLLVLSL